MKNVISIIGCCLLVLGCASKRNAKNVDSINETTPITVPIVKVKAKIGELSGKTDPFVITAVEIRGNLMYVDLEYSGGCEVHQFEVVGSQNIAKSLPPIRSIEIIHDASGDKCRKVETVKLEIDIRDLAYKQEKGSEIYLKLNGYEERIKYTYQ